MNVIPILEPTSILDIGEYSNLNPKAEMGMLCVISKFCALFFSLVMELPAVFHGDHTRATFDLLLIMCDDKCHHSMAALVPRSFLYLG